jgi:D-alanyl-D-alanine carboxypeptidase (penicillin-binding protein 5/6)
MSVYGRRRRRLLGSALSLSLAAAVFAAGPPLLRGNDRALNHGRTPSPAGRLNEDRTDLPVLSWPQQGQAALVLGNGAPSASPHEQPVPIASLAKVMTAYLTLARYPLSGAQDGFTITVTAAQAQAEAQDAAQDESDVAVQAGEQLSERQLLEALLVPSGNNIAQMLAAHVAGSETRFITEMNDEARALGMNHTIYTDPSGFAPSTVSTAADQLRIFQGALGFAVFRQIVSMAAVTLPVAGTLSNYDPLIGDGYAGKTGSDAAAGGCLAFLTHVMVSRRQLNAIGVVLGQGEGNDTSVLLAAAGAAAQQLVHSVAPATGVPAIPAPGGSGAPGTPGGRIPERVFGRRSRAEATQALTREKA